MPVSSATSRQAAAGSNSSAKEQIPLFWKEHYESGKGSAVCGMYGVCIDEGAGPGEFDYLIADNYDPAVPVPEGFVTRTIPEHTWAVFACRGPMPKALQDVNHKIFTEWLPNCRDYEIAAGLSVEMYTDISDYPGGNQDENYYSEAWVPVRKK